MQTYTRPFTHIQSYTCLVLPSHPLASIFGYDSPAHLYKDTITPSLKSVHSFNVQIIRRASTVKAFLNLSAK